MSISQNLLNEIYGSGATPDQVWSEITGQYHANDEEKFAAEKEITLRIQRAERVEAAREEAANRFLIRNPEFVANPRNGAILTTHMEAMRLSGSSYEDIERAYDALKGTGALEINQEVVRADRVAELEARTPRRRSSSGLSSKHSALPPPPPTDEEMLRRAETMPLAELEALINRTGGGF